MEQALPRGRAWVLQPGRMFQRQSTRVLTACAIGLLAASLSLVIHHLAPAKVRDIDILLQVSRGFLHGQNPYDVMGPGKAVEFPELMAYPFTEVLLLAPFAALPLWIGSALVIGIAASLWGWAVLASDRYFLAMVGGASLAMIFAVAEGQWSPLLTAAALVPALGWILAIKPTIGLALFAAFPSWRIVLGVAVFGAVALLIDPRWPFEWYRTTRTVQHLVAIVARPGGFLVLLALLRWRDAPARLLVTLACIPHTTLPYETLYLFLIPQTWERAWVLCGLSYIAPLLVGPADPMTHEYVQRYSTAILWTEYVPCTLMLLFPPRHTGAKRSTPQNLRDDLCNSGKPGYTSSPPTPGVL